MPYVVLHTMLKYNALHLWIEALFLSLKYRDRNSVFNNLYYLGRKHPAAWLDYAFNFGESPQGYAFWGKIRAEIWAEHKNSKQNKV